MTNYTIHGLIDKRKKQKIHAHHVIQSFSPDDKLSPEVINRIGYETIKELTGGNINSLLPLMLIRTIVIIILLSTQSIANLKKS